jgi:hypothetical protein
MSAPPDPLHEFLKGSAKESTPEFAEEKIQVSCIVKFLLEVIPFWRKALASASLALSSINCSTTLCLWGDLA